MKSFALLYLMALLVVFAIPFAFTLLALSIVRPWARYLLILTGAIVGSFAAIMLLLQGGVAFSVPVDVMTPAMRTIPFAGLMVMVVLTLTVHFRAKKGH